MATPRPGAPVRGSRTGRPIMAALDLLSRRWALRVLWELRGDPLTFRALREVCDEVSPSVLNTRLAELKEAGLVETAPSGYALTGSGRKLCRALAPLHRWAAEWSRAGAATATARPGSSRGARGGAGPRTRRARP